MYLRRHGWAASDSFSISTLAGEVRARITRPQTCTMDMGRAKLASKKDFPSGGDDGTGTLTAAGRELSFQFVSVGNPQCSIEVDEGLEELDLAELGPPIESHELFPNRTNVSFWRREGDAAIRARIFERGVGETMSSGTGATGAAVAAVVRGLDSPVTVRLDGGELEVDVAEDLHIDLTGWARPVDEGRRARQEADEGAACEPSSRLGACPRTCCELERKIAKEELAGVDVIELRNGYLVPAALVIMCSAAGRGGVAGTQNHQPLSNAALV